jgi:hypothetical protein
MAATGSQSTSVLTRRMRLVQETDVLRQAERTTRNIVRSISFANGTAPIHERARARTDPIKYQLQSGRGAVTKQSFDNPCCLCMGAKIRQSLMYWGISGSITFIIFSLKQPWVITVKVG